MITQSNDDQTLARYQPDGQSWPVHCSVYVVWGRGLGMRSLYLTVLIRNLAVASELQQEPCRAAAVAQASPPCPLLLSPFPLEPVLGSCNISRTQWTG